MFTKVKAALILFAAAALAGVAEAVAGYDWLTNFGAFGPMIGAGLSAGIAWLVKETNGYGAGVPKP